MPFVTSKYEGTATSFAPIKVVVPYTDVNPTVAEYAVELIEVEVYGFTIVDFTASVTDKLFVVDPNRPAFDSMKFRRRRL